MTTSSRGPAPDLEDHPEDQEQQLEEGGSQHLAAWSWARRSRHLCSAWLQQGVAADEEVGEQQAQAGIARLVSLQTARQ